jgi:hypothetical protein
MDSPLGIVGERFAGGRQHSDDTRFRIPHFGFKECGDESGHHLAECFTLLIVCKRV